MLKFLRQLIKSKPKTYTFTRIPNLSRKILYRAQEKYNAACLIQFGIEGGQWLFLQLEDLNIIMVEVDMFPFPGFDKKDSAFTLKKQFEDFEKGVDFIIRLMILRNKCEFANTSFLPHVIEFLENSDDQKLKDRFDYEYWKSHLAK